MKNQKKLISFLLSIILGCQCSFAQVQVDHPGNHGAPAVEREIPTGRHIDFYIPSSEKVGGSGGSNSFGEKSGSGGNGDGSKGNSGGVSGEHAGADRDFDRVIDHAGSGSSVGVSNADRGTSRSNGESNSQGFSSRGFREHAGESGDYRNTERRSNPSKTYDELIAKGQAAKQAAIKKLASVDSSKNVSFENFETQVEGDSYNDLNEVYEGDQPIIDPIEKRKLELMFNYSTINFQQNFIPFKQQILQSEFDLEKFEKTLIENELRAMFPGVREGNIAALSKARGMIRDWKIAEKAIDEAYISDMFGGAEELIFQMQKDLDRSYLGSSTGEYQQIVSDLEKMGSDRIGYYLDSFIQSTGSAPLGSTLPAGYQDGIRSLKNAKDNLVTSKDYVAIAADVTNAKASIFSASGQTEETVSPLEIYLIGSAVATGIAIPVVRSAIKKGGSSVGRSTLAKLTQKYGTLKAGRVINHGAVNPGILHYLEVNGTTVNVASTFKNSTYVARWSEEGEVLYKYVNEHGTRTIGPFFSKNMIKSSEEAQRFLALPNKPTHVVTYRIPKETMIFEGQAGKMSYPKVGTSFPGGAHQVYIDYKDLSKWDMAKYQIGELKKLE